MGSILDTTRGVCFVCGNIGHTDLHHCFFGNKHRKIADREGLTCYLCIECHKGTKGVHGKNGHPLDIMLKQIAQEEWELRYKERYPYKNHADEAAREAWLQMMGRNYL